MILLFTVSDMYIDYLRKFDQLVLYNKQEVRPYLGTIVLANSTKYYVPMSSPKEKFKKMKNSKDFHKIDGGNYGALNFNNMIPVKDSELVKIDIDNEPDELYKNLLQRQHKALSEIKETINLKAQALYNLYVCSDELTTSDLRVKQRCCNFPLLEEKMNEFKK